MKYSNILIAVSGLDVDDEAILIASDLAKRDHAKLLAVYVIEVERAMPLDAEQSVPIQRAEQILARAQNSAKRAGTTIETDLLQSRAAGPALVDEARERGVDLIIVGVPFRKRLENFYVGATASYLLKNAACRVWLCRQAAPDDKNVRADKK